MQIQKQYSTAVISVVTSVGQQPDAVIASTGYQTLKEYHLFYITLFLLTSKRSGLSTKVPVC